MFIGLYLLGVPLILAIILAGIAPATAPAPVFDVVREVNASGPYTDTLLGIVAVDDAWGMILFSFLLVVASMSLGNGEAMASMTSGLWELFGAVALGLIIGFPMAYITSHIYPGKASQAEVLGLVLLCAGFAEWFGVSYILSAMVMGTVVANFSKQHRHRPFEELETFQWPLLVLFLLLAGSALNLAALYEVGLIGFAYIVLRILGRITGSYLGAKWARCEGAQYHWMGLAMLPHAGVPIGMALVAIHHFPELKDSILPVILAATIIFEVIGPSITRMMLKRAGEGGVKK
jgi:Kef-type K+ transport system membrane component KefB